MKGWIYKFLGRNDKNGHMKGDKRTAILLISPPNMHNIDISPLTSDKDNKLFVFNPLNSNKSHFLCYRCKSSYLT